MFNNPLSNTDPSGFAAVGFQNQSSGGDYQLYAEPIASTTLSGQDSINTISAGQDINAETSGWLTWVNETEHPDSGYYETASPATMTISLQKITGVNTVEVARFDDLEYGLGTGGVDLGAALAAYQRQALHEAMFGPPAPAKMLQRWGDNAGWVDPSGIADGIAAFGYLVEGKFLPAGISVASIFGADALKSLRYADGAVAQTG